jgi:hypothetical protein
VRPAAPRLAPRPSGDRALHRLEDLDVGVVGPAAAGEQVLEAVLVVVLVGELEDRLAKLQREKTPKNTEDKREEKENKSFKKELREKLLKFVSRVPVFMYLTDYREETLKDVIMQLERPLFTKVTGLQIKDFEKMCEIGVFNSQAMNSAIFSFRRFELGSLHYAGGGTELETIGLFDTTVSAIEGL